MDRVALAYSAGLRLWHRTWGSGTKKAGSRAPWYGVACKPGIVIGILLLQDSDETLAADDVDAASLGIVEKIVRVTDDFGRRDCIATFRIKGKQARWHTPGSLASPAGRWLE